ncbi:manganese efflux pump [Heliobacterium gestii]|uniref:Putative manganese efflux pump MntP n=1 Tax=Heliomicrobium gestii TaxID=2699 RepID=A0A845LAC5_HELGE|nr:manganese efflux pump [Heliomicrobium gestii]MBM7866552.1 putative Mn2+ efflux pump MntP [Heliomicrobium gestii]MZP43168.1 manganese efflux pump [Heliomicrobium gestii]
MAYWTLGVLAVGLGADAFSMALGIGMEGVRRRDALILGIVVALFHIFMPWFGILAGSALGLIVGRLASFIGAAVLFFLGGRMIYHAWQERRDDAGSPLGVHRSIGAAGAPVQGGAMAGAGVIAGGRPFAPTMWGLVVIGAAVSMDALSVGFSLGTVGARLIPTVVTFGVVAGIMTVAGCLIGQQVSRMLGATAQLAGGLILLGIGIKLLLGSASLG